MKLKRCDVCGKEMKDDGLDEHKHIKGYYISYNVYTSENKSLDVCTDCVEIKIRE